MKSQIRSVMYAKLASLAFQRAQKLLNRAQSAKAPLVKLHAEETWLGTYCQGRKLANRAVVLGLPRARVMARE